MCCTLRTSSSVKKIWPLASLCWSMYAYRANPPPQYKAGYQQLYTHATHTHTHNLTHSFTPSASSAKAPKSPPLVTLLQGLVYNMYTYIYTHTIIHGISLRRERNVWGRAFGIEWPVVGSRGRFRAQSAFHSSSLAPTQSESRKRERERAERERGEGRLVVMAFGRCCYITLHYLVFGPCCASHLGWRHGQHTIFLLCYLLDLFYPAVHFGYRQPSSHIAAT